MNRMDQQRIDNPELMQNLERIKMRENGGCNVHRSRQLLANQHDIGEPRLLAAGADIAHTKSLSICQNNSHPALNDTLVLRRAQLQSPQLK